MTIVIPAYKIDVNRIEQFLSWNKTVFTELNIHVCFVTDIPLSFSYEKASSVVYPKEQKYFLISSTSNYGIRSVKAEGIIIKSDIDIVFSKELLQCVLKTVKPKKGLVCKCVNVSDYNSIVTADWKTKRKRGGKGACFAMHKSDWYVFGGYNEYLFGWGADDDDLWDRVSRSDQLQISLDSKYPLWHINHVKRRSKKGFFINRPTSNLKLSKVAPWDGTRQWGEAREFDFIKDGIPYPMKKKVKKKQSLSLLKKELTVNSFNIQEFWKNRQIWYNHIEGFETKCRQWELEIKNSDRKFKTTIKIRLKAVACFLTKLQTNYNLKQLIEQWSIILK